MSEHPQPLPKRKQLSDTARNLDSLYFSNAYFFFIKFITVSKVATAATPVQIHRMANYLDHIFILRRRLAAAERKRDQAYTELMAFLDTFAEDDIRQSSIKMPHASLDTIRVSKAWTKILQRLSRYRRFRVKDAVTESRSLLHENEIMREQTLGGARAQLSLLAKKGIVRRLGGGNYELTLQAKVRFDKDKIDGPIEIQAGDAR